MAGGVGMLNIPSSNTDPNYRYRMPKLISKVEGRGNGIKTNVMNMADIARALKRSPDYTTKFCGTELCAQSKFDTAEGKSIIRGAHESKDLQSIIDKFVDKYVLCPNCSLPEIDLVVKRGILGCHCNACGHNGDLDNSHKLAAFILRHPPEGSSTMGLKTTAAVAKPDKKERRKAKMAKEVDEDEGSGEKSKKKKKKKKSKDGGDDEDDADDDSGDGGGEEEKKKKKKKKKGAVGDDILEKAPLHYNSPELADVKQRMVLFAAKLREESGASSSTSLGIPPEAFFAELRVLQVSQDFDSVLRLFVTLEILLVPDYNPVVPGLAPPPPAPADGTADVEVLPAAGSMESFEKVASENPPTKIVTAEMFQEVMPFLKRVIDSSLGTAKACQGIEDFLALRCKCPESMKNLQFILHKLFSEELLEEDELVERYSPVKEVPATKESKDRKKKEKKAKKGAATPPRPEAVAMVKPFIKWLQEAASEEEDSEEDDEEDEEEEHESTGSGPAASEEAAHADEETKVEEEKEATEDDDELDIDDI